MTACIQGMEYVVKHLLSGLTLLYLYFILWFQNVMSDDVLYFLSKII